MLDSMQNQPEHKWESGLTSIRNRHSGPNGRKSFPWGKPCAVSGIRFDPATLPDLRDAGSAVLLARVMDGLARQIAGACRDCPRAWRRTISPGRIASPAGWAIPAMCWARATWPRTCRPLPSLPKPPPPAALRALLDEMTPILVATGIEAERTARAARDGRH
jgi:hypothetical protein